MPRLAAVLALASLAATAGCSRNALLATGAVMAGTGVVMAASPNTTETHTGFFNSNDTWEQENHDYDIAGGMLTVVGAVVLLAGALSHDGARTTTTIYPEPYYVPVYVPAPVEPMPPHPTTVINAPNAQTVIVTDTVVVESGAPVVNPGADDLP